MTYDNILQNMQNAFFEISGENAELLSDIGARFQAVASELFNLACYSEFIKKQAFVQTASGEYLDMHAEMRNMTRKTASKAYGEITFYAAEVSESDIEIPAGTICSAEGREYIQFETTESAVIPAGSESVTVPARALKSGSSYNAKANTVNVIVNPPGSISKAQNEYDFKGGNEEETDDALRKRLLRSYFVAPTGMSLKSMTDVVMKIDGVLDCNILRSDDNELLVYVRTKNDALTQDIQSSIDNALLLATLTDSEVDISLAEEDEYSLNVSFIVNNSNAEEAIEAVTKAIKTYTDSIRIGESIRLSDIESLASQAADIKNCIASSPNSTNGVIIGFPDTYLSAGEIVVQAYE